MADAFLAGDQLEQPIHRPQAQVAGYGAPHGVLEWHEQFERVDDHPQPQQRHDQYVGQQLMVGVDQAQGQQAPAQHQ
ncbi:hypothetical protein D3C76_1640770 [compost metagenome]